MATVRPDPAVAGNGHGRHLMQTAGAFLLSLECPKINSCVRRDNEAVIKFYDGLGYEKESAYYCCKRLIEDNRPSLFMSHKKFIK